MRLPGELENMIWNRFVKCRFTARLFVCVALLALSVATDLSAQEESAKPGSSASGASPAPAQPSPKSPSSPASAANWHALDASYYKRRWGVEIIGVRLVSSKSMLRFNYRVLDSDKAKTLNDKRWNPYLVDEATGAKLGIPEMDKVGKLRQSSEPENGQIYWMVFGNPSKLVKAGNRVDVVIGDFRAEGIVVE
jgi:hypothetical protein